jgi:hypothetical protein
MRRQKALFNDLLRRYNKYRNKLQRLELANRNEHRQGVLKKHIKRIYDKLVGLQISFKKTTTTIAGVASLMLFQVQNANAQIEFYSFNPNPYSLTDIGTLSDVEFVDLDADGDFDLMSGSTGDFHYLENIGTNLVPNYAGAQVNPFSLGSVFLSRSSPSFADLDNDGDFDLIAGDLYGNLTYYENTGTANSPIFSTAQSNPFSLTTVGAKSKPDFVDLDGDGDFDLMVGDNNGDLTYFENMGTVIAPSFGVGQVNPFLLSNVSGGSQNPDFVDLDNDGDLDMMCGRVNGQFYYYRNNGTVNTPSFVLFPTNSFNIIPFDSYSSPAFVDLDNDGDFDLMTGRGDGKFAYLENIGTNLAPSFTDPQTNLFSLTTITSANPVPSSSPSFGDLDNDGDLDMISGEQSGAFHYFENIGTNLSPNYGPVQINPFSLVASTFYNSRPDFVDLDNDGDLDLIAGCSQGHIVYFENIGTNTTPNYGPEQTNPFSLTNIGSSWSDPEMVDLDNDGDFDLMSGNNIGDFVYFENTGTASAPSFSTMQSNPFSLTGAGSYLSSPTFADLDNDGDFDLMAGEYYLDFKYFENTGTASAPSFSTVQTNPFSLIAPSSGFNPTPAFVDLDADGDFDLMVGGMYGSFKYYENTTVTTIGIEEPHSSVVTVYPNPTSDQLQVNSEEQVEEILIHDLFGAVVQQENTPSFSVANLASGVYLLQVKTNEGIVHSRFVKE